MQDLPMKAPYVQFYKRPALGAVIKIPPNPTEDHYKEPSDQEKKIIFEIISTVSRTGWINLALKRGHLNQLGAEIALVHPLKFLETIFTNPELVECMPEIFNSDLKRDGFMHGGLTANLNRESDKGRLKDHLDDFAQRVKAPREKLEEFFNLRNWEGMVGFLIFGR